jgi:hypothetical protein
VGAVVEAAAVMGTAGIAVAVEGMVEADSVVATVPTLDLTA